EGGHRHETPYGRVAAHEVDHLPGWHARLRRLAREVHLEQGRDGETACRGVGRERVDELADAVDDLHLVRLQVSDEVPPERIAAAPRAPPPPSVTREDRARRDRHRRSPDERPAGG